MKNLFIIVCFVITPFARAQMIVTFAGTGTGGGNNGDGGPALSAVINYPTSGAFDKNGNYYFTTATTGNTIRKIAPNGIISTVAGVGTSGYSGDNGPASQAQLDFPHDVAVDSFGNIFIADAENNRIRKIDILTGNIITIAGDGTANNTGDGGLAVTSSLHSPFAICFDKFSNLYISAGYRIRKIDNAGVISTVVGSGTSGHSGDGGLAVNAQIGTCYGICTDDTGNLFIADHSAIRKVDFSTGIIVSIAGNGIVGSSGDGSIATNAQIAAKRIALDRLGNLYIGEDGFRKVRVINNQGIINTVVGTGSYGDAGDGGLATNAQIKTVFGLALDSCGNLYLADGHSFRIRKVTFNDTCGQTNTWANVTLSSQPFNLYPNPANTQLTVTGNHLQSITITNTLGQVMHWQKASAEKTVVNVSHLNVGIYFITVTDKQGGKETKKIVKE